MTIRISVEESFPVSAEWKLRKPLGMVKTIEPRDALTLRQAGPTTQSLLDAVRQKAPVKYEKDLPAVIVTFRPKDRAIGERLSCEEDCKVHLLGQELTFSDLDSLAPCRTEADYEARKKMVYAAKEIHYVRLSHGEEMVVFGTALRFVPGETWAPKGAKGSKRKKKNGNKRLASLTQRRNAAVVVRCISINSSELDASESGDGNVYVNISETIGEIRVKAPRFSNAWQSLNYGFISKLDVGDVINPRLPLTRAYDNSLSFLQTTEDGCNVLTDFEDISIPLLWPNWSDPRLVELKSLETWSARSYEAFIQFLAGKFVDSLESLTAPERVDTERPAEGQRVKRQSLDKNRNGQCYHGDYENITLVGPYLVFEVEYNGVTFYILDSPFYGIALRAYWKKADAVDYAQGGKSRKRVEKKKKALIWPKSAHDPDGTWVRRVEDNKNTYVSAK